VYSHGCEEEEDLFVLNGRRRRIICTQWEEEEDLFVPNGAMA
jgi:hypothetical protein